MHPLPLLLATATAGVAAVAGANVPEAERAIAELGKPSDVVIVAWGALPALVGGLVVQIPGKAKIDRQMLGEVAASPVVGFIVAGLTHGYFDSLLSLGAACCAAGLGGSATLAVFRVGGKASAKALMGGWKEQARSFLLNLLKAPNEETDERT